MKNFTEFNRQAVDYAKYRPLYPASIFEFLSGLSPNRSVAYDVGTGNGQCAISLAEYFSKVYASDLSKEQIANAIPKKNVTYFVSESHESNIEASTVDLITAATAIHWFNFELFYKECKRILKNDGIIAAWSYDWHICENPEINSIVQQIGKVVLKDYWSSQPKLIWDGYKTIPFPFEEIETPKFIHKVTWNFNDLIGYLTTWSASQKYIVEKNKHPADDFNNELLSNWKDPEIKLNFSCPIVMRVGKHKVC